MIFFINGCLTIEKSNTVLDGTSLDSNKYEMRFLTETTNKTCIKMILCDESDNKLEVKNTINGLTVIKVDCTDFMEKFNWQNMEYMRINYKVYVSDDDGIDCEVFNGSFPIISPTHTTSLKFGSVSCNSNQNINDYNNYEYDTIMQHTDLWSDLSKRKNDIIFHTGNQIYGDFIIKNKIGYTESTGQYDIKKIYNHYATLYRTAYSEESQGTAMRNSLNIMMMNDHDICGGFAIPKSNKTVTDRDFLSYYFAGMEAYVNYQHQLHTNIDNKILDNIINGTQSIYYNKDYGRYNIIVLDQRHEIFHKEPVFSDKQLKWIDTTLTKSNNKRVIFVSPRPVGHLNKINAFFQGAVCDSGKDELFHPGNFERTLKFLNLLDTFKHKRDMVIVAGCLNKTYINCIYKKDELKPIVKQLVTGAITSLPIGYFSFPVRAGHWIQQKLVHFIIDDIVIGNKISVSDNNSYGIIENDMLSNYFIEDYNVNLFCSCLNYRK